MSDVEHLFMFVGYLYVFFGKLFRSSAHFLIELLFYIELHELFVYFGDYYLHCWENVN